MNLNEKRVIVEKYFPYSPFEVGAILYLIGDCYYTAPKLNDYSSPDDDTMAILASEVEKSTANFRHLMWHEHRTPEQLGAIEYVKVDSGKWNGVYSIDGWKNSFEGQMLYTFISNGDLTARVFIDSITPATPAEYEAFKTKTT